MYNSACNAQFAQSAHIADIINIHIQRCTDFADRGTGNTGYAICQRCHCTAMHTKPMIGMNIKNAIVLVDQIDIEAASGKAPLNAVISATTSRIIPVAMASGTTILGMLPLLFDAMFGGMAATIMGGLLVASALTLFVLPVAYCAIHKIKG